MFQSSSALLQTDFMTNDWGILAFYAKKKMINLITIYLRACEQDFNQKSKRKKEHQNKLKILENKR